MNKSSKMEKKKVYQVLPLPVSPSIKKKTLSLCPLTCPLQMHMQNLIKI